MNFLKSNPVLLLLLCLFLSPRPSYSRDRVDSYEKMNLLRRATGSDRATTDSFQARVDAILNPSTDPERVHIAAADEASRVQAQAKEPEELTPKSETAPLSQQTLPESGLVKSKEEDRKAKDLVDNSEKAYQKSLQKLQEEENEKKPEASKSKPSEKTSTAKQKLLPSLANNPFYSKEKAGGRDPLKQYEASKPIIVSRLVGNKIFGEEEAQELVARAETPEELVMLLMEQNLTYGEATDAVQTSE